jgi:hypothetical protein
VHESIPQSPSSLAFSSTHAQTTVAACPAVLTPDRRKRLVLAAGKVYEREIEANSEKSSFQLRLADGTLAVVPMQKSFHPHARSHGGRLA